MEHNKLHTKKGKLSSVTCFTSILNMILKEVQLQENGERFKIFVMIYSGLVLVFQVFMESIYCKVATRTDTRCRSARNS